jgi:hypothetical protein
MVFGVLLALDPARQARLFSGSGGLAAGLVGRVARDWLEIFVIAAGLLTAYFFCVELWLPDHEAPLQALLFPAGAAALGGRGKKSSIFRAVAAGLALYPAVVRGPALLEEQLMIVLRLAATGLLLELLVHGLRVRLLLAAPPKPLEGPAVLFAALGLLGLALSGLAGILF